MKTVNLKDLPKAWLQRLDELALSLETKEDLIVREAWHETKMRGWPDRQSVLCAREWARGAFVEGLHGAFYAIYGCFPIGPEEEAGLSDLGVVFRRKAHVSKEL